MLSKEALLEAGLPESEAEELLAGLGGLTGGLTADHAWASITRSVLRPTLPFAVHRLLFDAVYRDWPATLGPRPAWLPTEADIAGSNIRRFCQDNGIQNVNDLHTWSVADRGRFWRAVVSALEFPFKRAPEAILDTGADVEAPQWLRGARLNAADACFLAPGSATAIRYQPEGRPISELTYAELDRLSNRFASAVRARGIGTGDAIAIAMPMTVEAVAAYLGIVKCGGVVVSIADSFAPEEIATRLRIGRARAVLTQDVVQRAGKTFPMYEKVVSAGASTAIVVPAGSEPVMALRGSDVLWRDFLSDNDRFVSVDRSPDDVMNILFSSGTTGEPKAIPWVHSTAIKCAMDGYLHHNIVPDEVVAWPTNLGWMMGPWLIYASLINRGTIALYYGAPNSRGFCEFVDEAGVAMLGVVPSLVKAWRSGNMIDGCDWTAIDVFSSTGESSNVDDMLYLMSRAGYRPVIEYCGGTEIGGGYITGTVTRPAAPAAFSSPAFGLDFFILDDDGKPADNGELFLVPPSIGLSNRLLNRDHHEVYYEGTPAGPNGELLRRHGDQMEVLPAGFFRAHGRADDTMNLGGIKVSSAEIERTVNALEAVRETAAIAVDPPGGGPSRLVIYAVLEDGSNADKNALKKSMQGLISEHLNPLFRVHDLVFVDSLPRTASNKVMRRVLRDRYGMASDIG